MAPAEAVHRLDRLRDATSSTPSRSSTSSPPTASTRPSPVRRPLAAKREAARVIVEPSPSDDPHRRDAATFLDGTDSGQVRRPASTRSTCGSAASPNAPTCSAASSAARSTTCSRSQLTDLQNGDRLYYLGPHSGHEPAHPARGQLVRRARHAQHRGAPPEGRLVRHGRLQVRARNFVPRRHEPVHHQRDAVRTTRLGVRREPLLIRMADGTSPAIATINTVDPPGINGQSGLQRTVTQADQHLRRRRQRHVPRQRRQRHHRGERRRRRRARRRGRRHHHRPRR